MKNSLLIFVFFVFASTAQAQLQPITNSKMVGAINAALPSQWSSTWGTPDHLLTGGFLNSGDRASFVTLKDQQNKQRATILAIRTQCSSTTPLGVYPHDYRRCSSIHGRTLAEVSQAQIFQGWFHKVHTTKHVLVEHEISFIAEDQGANIRIDSELFSSLYSASCGGPVYNFQVWSDNSSLTNHLVTSMLSHFASVGSVSYSNNSPAPLPSATMKAIIRDGNTLDLAVESNQAEPQAQFTVVAWRRPNPAPIVTRHPIALQSGLQSLQIPLAGASADATEFEVYLAINGTGVDEVLAASNHFGHFTSHWMPFVGPSSSVQVRASNTSPTIQPTVKKSFSLNDSIVRLDCNLSARSWCGFFSELLPELSASELEFGAFDGIRFYAKQSSQPVLQQLEMKLETDTIFYRATFPVSSTWAPVDLPLTSFRGPSNQPWNPSARIKRISFAAVSGSTPVNVDFSLAALEVIRPPRLNIELDGQGSVVAAPFNITCTERCARVASRGTTVTLTPTPNAGYRFLRWNDPQCTNFQLDEDVACIAEFAPQLGAPLVSMEPSTSTSSTRDSTRILISDNTLNDINWSTLQFRLGPADLTAAFISIAAASLEIDPAITRVYFDIPLSLSGYAPSLSVCRFQSAGGQCGSDALP
ncbi:hypothetical protein MRY87_11850 [bacterium]|nr:hypothetical protein [bacterium]